MSAIATGAGVPLPTAHRELERLIDSGLLIAHREGRQRLVGLNPDSPYLKPLRQIMEVAFGAQVVLGEALTGIPGIRWAAIYGSYAARATGEPGPEPQDIDLLIVGDAVPIAPLYEACRLAEKRLQRPVNPTVLRPSEYDDPDDGFIRTLRSRPMLAVLGTLPDSLNAKETTP